MKFTSDKITFTDSMKSFVEDVFKKKLTKLVPEAEAVEIKLSKLNNDIIKIDLSIDKFKVQTSNKDFYVAFVEAINKIKNIIIKNNKKIIDNKRKKTQVSIFELGVEDTMPVNLISKEKLFILAPITLEEAIDELECTDYLFYVFKNIEDEDNVSIIYKRHNDEYGLIRCR